MEGLQILPNQVSSLIKIKQGKFFKMNKLNPKLQPKNKGKKCLKENLGKCCEKCLINNNK